jgi:hypothetical protein
MAFVARENRSDYSSGFQRADLQIQNRPVLAGRLFIGLKFLSLLFAATEAS